MTRALSPRDRALYERAPDSRRREFLAGRALLGVLRRREGTAVAASTSISHCPTHVAVAGAIGSRNGVDVESAPTYLPRAIARVFGPEQERALTSLEPHSRVFEFRKAWSLREAAYKTGAVDLFRGLDLPLPDEGVRGAWRWITLQPWSGVTLAHVSDGGPVRCEKLEAGWTSEA